MGQSKRIEYIDTAKFIGIILVIFAHCLEGGPMVPYIYSFHLPLFFVINGLTFKLRENDNFGNFLVRKIKGYVIPTLFLGVFCIIFDALFSKTNFTFTYFMDNFVELIIQKRVFALWFVGALFCSDLLFYFVLKVSKQKLSFTIITSLIFLGIAIIFNIIYPKSLPWNFDVSLFGVFFVSLGYIFRRKELENVYNFCIKKRLYSLLIGCLSLTIGLLLEYINYKNFNLHLEMWGLQYQKYYLVIPSAIFGSFGIILISDAITNKAFGELGKTTLVLLAFHQTLSMPLFKNDLFPEWYSYINSLPKLDINRPLFALVETLFSLVMLLPIHYLIIYSPLAICLNQKIKPFWSKLINKVFGKEKSQESL